MISNADIVYYFLFGVTCVILVQTSFTDVRRRMINSYIFLPVLALGAVYHVLTAAPYFFVIAGILVFLATFLDTRLLVYPVIGTIFVILSFYLIMTGSIFYGITLGMMSLMFLIGFQERLFGIGDVKAVVSLFYAFTSFPFLTVFTQDQVLLSGIMPISIMMLFNIAVVSIFFVPYVILLNRRRGDRLNLYSITSISYDEATYSSNEAKYNVHDTPNGKRMVYKTPFMLAVSAGFIITMIFGYWFLLI